MNKILGYRKSFTHRLDGMWEWSCPVWFSESNIFADATIKCAHFYETENAAIEGMTETMKKFGVTIQTKII